MMSNGNCGCGPSNVSPGNQVIIPAGTHIVQTPCPAVPSQSVAVVANAFNSGQAAGQAAGNCGGFVLPKVARSFIAAGTGQVGSFFSDCAASWGLPGMMLYFPSQGQVELVGVGQNTVTYKNRTMAPGTEVLQGTSFAVGIPIVPMEVEDTEVPTTPGAPTEPTYQDATLLSNIRGVANSVLSRIFPISNNVLVGREGYWQRRPLGRMRYPIAITSLLGTAETAATKTWNVNLPQKPTLPAEVDGFSVELQVRLWVARPNNSDNYLEMKLKINDFVVVTTGGDRFRNENGTFHIADLAKDATSITIKTERSENLPGTMGVVVLAMAYHY